MLLKGSCHCGAVRFSLNSRTPYPYMRCYCSICRKTGGGGVTPSTSTARWRRYASRVTTM